MAAHFDFLRHRLAKEISLILVIKLILLMGIKTFWFDAPTVPRDGSAKTGQHLLGRSTASTPAEEKPR